MGIDFQPDMKALDQALFAAAREGHVDEVRRLIRAGADPNSVDPTDCDHGEFLVDLTPLMVAAGSPRSNVGTVRALLELGADPTRRSLGGTTALWYAAGGLGFSLESTDWELGEGHAYRDWGGGDVERLRILLDAGGDPNETPDNGRSVLNEAASAGDPKRLKLLIDRGALVKSSGLCSYCVPLFSAADSGSLECVQIILDQGFPADYNDNDNGNALDRARTVEIAELLWNAGVRPVEHLGFFDSVDELFENGRYEVASLILSKLPASPERSLYLNEALCKASGIQMNPKAVQVLVGFGADVNAQRGYTGTALHSACWQGDGNCGRPTETVRETLELLIAAGAKVDNNLPEYGTPLHQAVAGDWGSPTSTSVLIQHGAAVNAVDSAGETPLMGACRVGGLECIRLLLAANADRDIRDHSGRTAMDYALAHLACWRKIVSDPSKERGSTEDREVTRARHESALADADEVVRLLSS